MKRKVSKLLCFFMVLSIITTFFSVQAFSAQNEVLKPIIAMSPTSTPNVALMPKPPIPTPTPTPTPTLPRPTIPPVHSYDMTVEISSVNAQAGKEVLIPILFKDIPSRGINNLDFRLSFDPNVLKITEVKPGDILTTPSGNFYHSINGSTMTFMYVDETGTGKESIYKNGTFAIIKAFVNTNPLVRSTSIKLQPSDGVFSDYNLQIIEPLFIEGQITVQPPQPEKLRVEVSNVKGYSNFTYEVPVSFINVPDKGILHFDFALSYNPKDLEVVEVVPGELLKNLPQGSFSSSINNNGQVYFLFLDETGTGQYAIKNDGTVFSLKVKLKTAAVGKTSIIEKYPTDGVFGDLNLNIIPTNFVAGGVFITPTPTPSITITPTPIATPTPPPPTQKPIKLTVKDVEGRVGDTIKIPVIVEDVPATGINNCNFKLNYDQKVFEILSVSPGSILINPNVNFLYSNFPEKGSISMLYIDEEGIGNGTIKKNGDFAIITAKIIGTDTTGYSTITIPTKPTFSDFNLKRLSVETKDGKITILPPAQLVGDLNDDKLVDSTDLAWMKRYVLEIIKELPVKDSLYSADLNRDGVIDSTDLAVLKRYVLGIYTKLPI